MTMNVGFRLGFIYLDMPYVTEKGIDLALHVLGFFSIISKD